MKENDLNKVLNYMKQYVENKYEHDSEPMLNYKDLQLVLEEIERLNNIINELEKELKDRIKNVPDTMAEVYEDKSILHKLQELKGIIKEVREYINNHQLVFRLSSKKQIENWFDRFYKEILEILDKGEKYGI